MIYMLSPVNSVPDHRDGRLYTYPPHGVIVQPLGEREAGRLVTEHRSLVERVQQYVDLDVRGYAGAGGTCHANAD